MENNIMVSILLPVYNGERYLSDSIESILKQTYENFELIIGFNGTSDSSKEIAKKYLSDSRIIIKDYGEDRGKGRTLNKMIKESSFDWVALQDDDDVWHPEKLEKQISNSQGFDIIGTQAIYIDEKGEEIKRIQVSLENESIQQRSKNGDNQIINSSSLFRKESAFSIGGWKEDIDGIEDFDFWLRLMREGNKFLNLNEYLILHRIHEKSNFNTKKQEFSKIL